MNIRRKESGKASLPEIGTLGEKLRKKPRNRKVVWWRRKVT